MDSSAGGISWEHPFVAAIFLQGKPRLANLLVRADHCDHGAWKTRLRVSPIMLQMIASESFIRCHRRIGRRTLNECRASPRPARRLLPPVVPIFNPGGASPRFLPPGRACASFGLSGIFLGQAKWDGGTPKKTRLSSGSRQSGWVSLLRQFAIRITGKQGPGRRAGGGVTRGIRAGCDSMQKPCSHDTSRIARANQMARVAEELLLECRSGGGSGLIPPMPQPGPIQKILPKIDYPFACWKMFSLAAPRGQTVSCGGS